MKLWFFDHKISSGESFLELLETELLMQCGIKLLQKVIEGNIDSAIMTLVVCIVLDGIEISTSLIGVLFRITT